MHQFTGLLLVAVLAAPGNAEGRITEHEVETVLRPGQLIARFAAGGLRGNERVAEENLGLLVVLDQQIGLADGVVGGGKLLAVNGDESLDLIALFGGRGPVQQMFLGHGQHAAGAAGRIVDGEVPVRDGDCQQFDHQPDDLARGEVLSGLFAALL